MIRFLRTRYFLPSLSLLTLSPASWGRWSTNSMSRTSFILATTLFAASLSGHAADRDLLVTTASTANWMDLANSPSSGFFRQRLLEIFDQAEPTTRQELESVFAGDYLGRCSRTHPAPGVLLGTMVMMQPGDEQFLRLRPTRLTNRPGAIYAPMAMADSACMRPSNGAFVRNDECIRKFEGLILAAAQRAEIDPEVGWTRSVDLIEPVLRYYGGGTHIATAGIRMFHLDSLPFEHRLWGQESVTSWHAFRKIGRRLIHRVYGRVQNFAGSDRPAFASMATAELCMWTPIDEFPRYP